MSPWRASAFFRSVYQDNALRREYRRGLYRDLLQHGANLALRPRERLLARRYRDDSRALVFIVGAPRSGTTLLHQLSARHLGVGWIRNSVARWWLAPVWATARALRASPGEIALRSELGRTEGPDSPHEFSYFWQYWGVRGESDELTPAEVAGIRWPEIREELYGLAGLTGAPLVLKNLNHVSCNIPAFAAALPNLRFVHLVRDPRFVVQSILESRVQRYGDERIWWSVRPADFRQWLGRDPLEQVVHQVRAVERRVAQTLEALPADRWMRLRYEDLAGNPGRALRGVAEFLAVALREPQALAELTLRPASAPRLSPQRWQALERELGEAAT